MTSCGRFDLLDQTLSSFLQTCDHDIKKFIIIDDSTDSQCHSNIRKKYQGVELITNDERIGQIKSIDKMYSHVDTEYIFHCEDDWLFFKSGYLNKSLKLLESDSNIFQCWIRDRNDHNHPTLNETEEYGGIEFKEMLPMWEGIYSGFTFNPSLIRKSDYDKLGNYYKIGGETKIGHFLKNKFNHKFVTLTDGYVKHIGYSHHVDDIDVEKNRSHYYDFKYV